MSQYRILLDAVLITMMSFVLGIVLGWAKKVSGEGTSLATSAGAS